MGIFKDAYMSLEAEEVLNSSDLDAVNSNQNDVADAQNQIEIGIKETDRQLQAVQDLNQQASNINSIINSGQSVNDTTVKFATEGLLSALRYAGIRETSDVISQEMFTYNSPVVAIESIGENIKKAIEYIIDKFKAMWNWIKEKITALYNNISKSWENLIERSKLAPAVLDRDYIDGNHLPFYIIVKYSGTTDPNKVLDAAFDIVNKSGINLLECSNKLRALNSKWVSEFNPTNIDQFSLEPVTRIVGRALTKGPLKSLSSLHKEGNDAEVISTNGEYLTLVKNKKYSTIELPLDIYKVKPDKSNEEIRIETKDLDLSPFRSKISHALQDAKNNCDNAKMAVIDVQKGIDKLTEALNKAIPAKSVGDISGIELSSKLTNIIGDLMNVCKDLIKVTTQVSGDTYTYSNRVLTVLYYKNDKNDRE